MNTKLASSLYRLTRLDAILAFLCFVGGLVLYVRTLAPGLLRDDSAEFQTLAYTLGMTHPTGYPVYLLLAKLFTLLVPVRDIAYRVNLLSAVLAALVLSILYLAGRMLAGWRLAAVAGALSLGTIGLFWSQAIIAELYTAAAAFIATEFFLVLAWRQNGKWGYLFAAGLLGGLSLGVHSTVVLIAPAIMIYLFLITRRRADWFAAIGGGALGLVLSLLAFLALDALNVPSSYFNSVARPSLSVWGLTSTDFASPFQRLAFLYTAYQFRKFMLNGSVVGYNAGLYLQGMDWSVYILIALGLVRLFTRHWKEALLITLSCVVMMAFVLTYAIWDIYVFFLPTFIPMMLIILSGLGALMDAVAWLLKRLRVVRWSALGVNFVIALLVVGLFIPTVPVVVESVRVGYPTFLAEWGLDEGPYPLRSPDLPHRQARAIVSRLEENAIVFTNWGMLYDFYYVAHVEEGRTGLTFHETFPQEGVTEFAQSARQYIADNMGKRPIYTTEHSPGLLRYYKLIKVDDWLDLYRLELRP